MSEIAWKRRNIVTFLKLNKANGALFFLTELDLVKGNPGEVVNHHLSGSALLALPLTVGDL